MSRVAAPADADAARLGELGYRQELERRLHLFDNVALGFAAISPVVGLYAVALVGMLVAGPAWVWVLPVALAGQCLLLAVYAELASQFPIAGGAYQWTRRLIGPKYGWLTGWVAICAYAVANTTVAYLGAPWALTLLGIEASASALVVTGMVLVLICATAGAFGVGVMSYAVKAGVAAEAVASVGIGLALLLVFREQDFSLLGETLGAEALSGGSTPAGLLAALAVGGWVFIGFDVCIGASEETQAASRHVPRAIWIALLTVGVLVIVNGIAVTLAQPDPAAVVAGENLDPVTTAVVNSFGSWSSKPFAAIVLVAFLACGMASQAGDEPDDLLRRSRRRAARRARAPPRRPAPHSPGRDRADRADRLPRSAARPRVGRRRQPHHLRDGGDLRLLPVDRARCAGRTPARQLAPGGQRAARASGPRHECPGRRLAQLRDREHRLAARVPRARRERRGTRCGRRRSCSR